MLYQTKEFKVRQLAIHYSNYITTIIIYQVLHKHCLHTIVFIGILFLFYFFPVTFHPGLEFSYIINKLQVIR